MTNEAARGAQAIIAITAVAMMVCLTSLPPVLRLFFALPLVLFLPGHAVLRCVTQGLGRLEHVLFAIGLSMAIVMLGGLVLHPFRAMTPQGWAILLGAVTIGAAAWSLRNGEAPDPRIQMPKPKPVGRCHAAMIAASVAIVLGAFLIAQISASGHREFLHTDFWIVPMRADAAVVGIKNQEKSPAKFDVEVTFDGQMADVWRGIELRPGQSWTGDVRTGRIGWSPRIEARLFREGDHGRIYRRAWIAESRRMDR